MQYIVAYRQQMGYAIPVVHAVPVTYIAQPLPIPYIPAPLPPPGRAPQPQAYAQLDWVGGCWQPVVHYRFGGTNPAAPHPPSPPRGATVGWNPRHGLDTGAPPPPGWTFPTSDSPAQSPVAGRGWNPQHGYDDGAPPPKPNLRGSGSKGGVPSPAGAGLGTDGWGVRRAQASGEPAAAPGQQAGSGQAQTPGAAQSSSRQPAASSGSAHNLGARNAHANSLISMASSGLAALTAANTAANTAADTAASGRRPGKIRTSSA
ncbi:hypothetical protein B2J93_9538 [Marssonina coronariae]|uniref:Uncharacterized protein n=1 Tax=Diplocarpon coronariae TaxID=2795749 RepID=A0A218ZH71_9HELO|nr:hypothetical protein B2J93_9538 [Marssonina coronariae]